EAWSGPLADPELNEPEKTRKGFKITVHLTGEMPVPGRNAVTLWVSTADQGFTSIMTTFFVQRGIVVMPAELYLGEITSADARFSILVIGPTNSFHIRRVSSDWPHLS